MAELLAPAGNMESAIAAINAGADALYLGGKNFSARSAAQNFDDDAIAKLIQYAAVRNVRIFIAVNTLYKDNEMPQVVRFVGDMHRAGAAAFILQDAGLAYILKTHFPQVEIHASTQMTIHNTAGAKFMEEMGFSRVVLARELSLVEVAEINAATNIECEVFVHGALCVSYSGQCLMSSLIGGRSGNRGKCAQICRTKFKLDGADLAYLLSPKDMMTLEILDEIVATGVAALKIEGRMKSPEYVYLVTKAYRDKLDNMNAMPSKETIQDLLQIFNRGGSFCTGYYKDYRGLHMMSTQTPKSTGVWVGSVVSCKNGVCKIKFDKEVSPGDGIEIWPVSPSGEHVGTGISKKVEAGGTLEITLHSTVEKGCAVYKSYDKGLVDATKKAMLTNEKKVAVLGVVCAIAGENLKLTLAAGDVIVEKTGDVVEIAQNAPMSQDEIVKQLSKTGGTPFNILLDPQSNRIDSNIFISKSALNQLRRDALAELEAVMKENVVCHCVDSWHSGQLRFDINDGPQTLSVQLHNIAYLDLVLSTGVSRVYVNIDDFSPDFHMRNNAEIFLALPLISRNKANFNFAELEATGIAGYLVSNHGQLQQLQAFGTAKKIMLNYSFNVFNSYALEFFTNMGVGVTLSQELNLRETSAMQGAGFELIVYGRQTLMSTHNCPVGLYSKCNAGTILTDRLGVNFPILTDCRNCIAHILNGKTLDTSQKFQAIKNAAAASFRLVFTTEDEKTICDTISRYQKAVQGKDYAGTTADFTYGHYFRGVE